VTAVKVCGLTCVEDAELAVDCGADAVGVNLISGSKRAVDLAVARRIAAQMSGRATVVAVVADLPLEELRRLRERTRVDLLQLHGSEPPEVLAALLPFAYQALRIGGPEDVARAAGYGGDRILVDAKIEGELGGTGRQFDWKLVKNLATARRLVLAGGLTPGNVAEAIRAVAPWGVDVASGVERDGQPRRKDADKLRRFMEAVRGTG
jgi:phosphoribosylanthranilate isomerase